MTSVSADHPRAQCRGLVIAALLGVVLAQAVPAANGLLEDVVVSRSAGRAIIEISFNCTMRYVTHFPQDSGDELRVKVSPVRLCPGDELAVKGTDAEEPRDAELAELTEVIYEGDTPGGPFLTLYFRRAVAFEVSQGSDFRSIKVTVTTEPKAE